MLPILYARASSWAGTLYVWKEGCLTGLRAAFMPDASRALIMTPAAQSTAIFFRKPFAERMSSGSMISTAMPFLRMCQVKRMDRTNSTLFFLSEKNAAGFSSASQLSRESISTAAAKGVSLAADTAITEKMGRRA